MQSRVRQFAAASHNNLKQLGLAVANYESTYGSLPSDSYSGLQNWQYQYPNFSVFVFLSQFMEQGAVYNSTNFNLSNYEPDNITIAGIAIASLHCPSDPWNPSVISTTTPFASFVEHVKALPAGTWMQQFTSYGASQGTFPGTWQQSYGQGEFPQYNGVIYNDSAVKISGVTDGTSNTFLFGERAQTLFTRNDPLYQNSDGSWNSHHWFDTMVTTYYPPNVSSAGGSVPVIGGIVAEDAASLHPGGVNWGFCDGSVRFAAGFGQFLAVHCQYRLLLQQHQLGSARCRLRELHLHGDTGRNAVWCLPGAVDARER